MGGVKGLRDLVFEDVRGLRALRSLRFLGLQGLDGLEFRLGASVRLKGCARTAGVYSVRFRFWGPLIAG